MTMSIDGTLTLSAQTQIFWHLRFVLLSASLYAFSFCYQTVVGMSRRNGLAIAPRGSKKKASPGDMKMKARSTKGLVDVLIDSVNGPSRARGVAYLSRQVDTLSKSPELW